MAKRQPSSHRKRKPVAKEVTESGRQTRSRKITIAVTTEAEVSSSPSPVKEDLCQYYPTRKRSQPSPRITVKFTRLKSPPKVKTLLSTETFIGYGDDVDDDHELVVVERFAINNSKQTAGEGVNGVIGANKSTACDDVHSLLTTWKSCTTDDNDDDVCDQNGGQSSGGAEGVPQMEIMTDALTALKPFEKTFGDNSDNNLDNESIDRNNEIVSDLCDIEVDVQMASDSDVRKVNGNDCGDDEDVFDDSLDEMLSQYDFPPPQPTDNNQKDMIEVNDVHNDVKELNGVDSNVNEANGVDNDVIDAEEWDDGFESDDEFERMITQLPTEALMGRSDSGLETTRMNASTASTTSSSSDTSLMTLSQMIALINSQ